MTAIVTGCTATAPLPVGQTGERETPQRHPSTEPALPPAELTVDNNRESAGVVAAGGTGAPYNYGPTIIKDSDGYHMWWCSQYAAAKPAGDDVLYATTAELDQRFSGPGGAAPQAVFSGSKNGFDGMHTCDPSVIEVDGTYYLYYTGAEGDQGSGNAIGVATSDDGVNWRRANDGRPVVTAAGDVQRDNAYGAGQPAAVYVRGRYYLMFTDTTAEGAGWNGAGQFLLRSPDPTFAEKVEALDHAGFVQVEDTARPRTSSLVDAFSADVMWVEVLDAFVIAHQTSEGTSLTFWNTEFTEQPHPPVTIPGPWREGPGLVRTPHGHGPLDAADPCGTVAVDVVRATVNLSAPTDLRRFGLDLRGVRGCVDTGTALRVLNGYALPSPERTMDLVVDGKVVRVDRRSVAEELADRVLEKPPAHLATLPVAARLEAGAEVLHSPSEGSGVVLDDGRLWPLGTGVAADVLAELNSSQQRTVSDRKMRSYEQGRTLG